MMEQKQDSQGKPHLIARRLMGQFYCEILWELSPSFYVKPLQEICPDLWEHALQLQAEYREDTQRLVNELQSLRRQWIRWAKSYEQHLTDFESLHHPSSPLYQPIEAFRIRWKLPATISLSITRAIANNRLDSVAEWGIDNLGEELPPRRLPPTGLPDYNPLFESEEEYWKRVKKVIKNYIRQQNEYCEKWLRCRGYPSLREWRRHPGKHPRYLHRLAWQVYFRLHHNLSWVKLAEYISKLEAELVQLIYQLMAQYQNWLAAQQQTSPRLLFEFLEEIAEVKGWKGFDTGRFALLIGLSDQIEYWAIKDQKWIVDTVRCSKYTPDNMLRTTSYAIQCMDIPLHDKTAPRD
jgi:hypothetical protein